MSPGWSQTLIEPITAEAPCGESLEDTQLLASFDAFRVFGQATPLEPAPLRDTSMTKCFQPTFDDTLPA